MYRHQGQDFQAEANLISGQSDWVALNHVRMPELEPKRSAAEWNFLMSARRNAEDKILLDVTKRHREGWRWTPRWDAPFAKEPILSASVTQLSYPIPSALGEEAEKHQTLHKKRLNEGIRGDVALMAIYAENYFYGTLALEHFKKTGEDTYAPFRETAQDLMTKAEDRLFYNGTGIVSDLNNSLRVSVSDLRDKGHLKI
jgi:hypothetical protein